MNIYWEEHDRSGEKPEPYFKCNEDVVTAPKAVGGYDITGNGGRYNTRVFTFFNKPNWFHRFFCRLLLGWVWVDFDKVESKKTLLKG